MGSRLSRQNSLDNDNFSRRRRKHLDSTGESDRSGSRGSGDFLFTSLMLKSDKLPGMLRRTNHCPYVRRVTWIREIQKLLRERKLEQATDVLKLLRKVRLVALHTLQRDSLCDTKPIANNKQVTVTTAPNNCIKSQLNSVFRESVEIAEEMLALHRANKRSTYCSVHDSGGSPSQLNSVLRNL